MIDYFLNIFHSKTGEPRRTLPVAGIFFYFFTLIFCAGLPCPSPAQAPCLAEPVAARNRLRFPEMEPLRLSLQTRMDQALHLPQTVRRSVVTIPVVVHVVYKEAQENITEDQIFSQIAVLNQDYRRLNANANTVPPIFAPLAADVELEFCLAGQDPAGQPTNGITRRQTPWSGIGDLVAPDGRPRIHYAELGGADAWDTEHYLNIWIGTFGGGGLGSATFPGAAPPEEDGVVIDPRYFGTTGLAAGSAPHHLGRTATHETGHYFNLKHIWGGDANVCTDDDDVADTPVQRSAYLGCPSFPQFSCGNSAMFMNYMDYTDDACMSLFTQGQKSRMWAALNAARPGLLGDAACLNTKVQAAGDAAEWLLSPNPAGDFIRITLRENTPGPLRVEIRDAAGKLWHTQKVETGAPDIELNLSALPKGYYLFFLDGEKRYGISPFIKVF